MEVSNGGTLTAGPAGLGSEVELVLASIGMLMFHDVSHLLMGVWISFNSALLSVYHRQSRLYSAACERFGCHQSQRRTRDAPSPF